MMTAFDPDRDDVETVETEETRLRDTVTLIAYHVIDALDYDPESAGEAEKPTREQVEAEVVKDEAVHLAMAVVMKLVDRDILEMRGLVAAKAMDLIGD